MKKRDYVIFFILEILLLFLITFIQKTPGYMDAEYYSVTGKLIASGNGLREPFIWNYLDDPTGLPNHAFTYWMPLPALIAAAGFLVFGLNNFLSGRVFFILLSGMLPIITSIIAYRMTRKRADGLLAGFLAIFSGFYIVFLSIPESLLIYMICGGSIYLLIDRLENDNIDGKHLLFASIISGAMTGLMHLSRADGLIWVIGLLIYLLIFGIRKKKKSSLFIGFTMLFLFGYLAVMGFWYFRNISAFGSLFPPGNSKTLWITSYNQMFSYPSSLIKITNWLDQSPLTHLKVYLNSFLTNAKNLFAVEGLVFLLPFMIIGLLKNFKKPVFIFLLSLFVINSFAMTFVFPFAGMRGGFIHSTAAFQLLFWALVPVGLTATLNWAGKRRGWKIEKSTKMFYPAVIVLALLVTAIIFVTRVFSLDLKTNIWDRTETQMAKVEKKLVEFGAASSDVVIMNDPPGYYWVTGRPAVAQPDGDEDTIVKLSEQYHVKYLILDKDHAAGFDEIFTNASDTARLKLLFVIEGNIQIYEIGQ